MFDFNNYKINCSNCLNIEMCRNCYNRLDQPRKCPLCRSNNFKEDDGEAYNIDGKVFWEWYDVPLEQDEVGYPGFRKIKSYYSSRDSRVPVTFPYTIPNEPIYEYRESNTK